MQIKLYELDFVGTETIVFVYIFLQNNYTG